MDSIYLLPGEERCVNFRDSDGIPTLPQKGSGTASIPYNKEYKVRSQKYTASAAQAQMPTDSISIN